MIDGMDDRLTQVAFVTRQESQPGIGSVDGVFGGPLDEPFGDALVALIVTAENGVEEVHGLDSRVCRCARASAALS